MKFSTLITYRNSFVYMFVKIQFFSCLLTGNFALYMPPKILKNVAYMCSKFFIFEKIFRSMFMGYFWRQNRIWTLLVIVDANIGVFTENENFWFLRYQRVKMTLFASILKIKNLKFLNVKNSRWFHPYRAFGLPIDCECVNKHK